VALNNDSLFRNTSEEFLLTWLSKEEATYVLNEVYVWVCDTHEIGSKLTNQIKRLTYH